MEEGEERCMGGREPRQGKGQELQAWTRAACSPGGRPDRHTLNSTAKQATWRPRASVCLGELVRGSQMCTRGMGNRAGSMASHKVGDCLPP